MLDQGNVVKVRYNSADGIIGNLVQNLNQLERRGDSASWQKAKLYVEAYNELKLEPEYEDLRGNKLSYAINKAIRATAAELHLTIPKPSFLTDAKKVAETWSELFTCDMKKWILSYEHYRMIANCSLDVESKNRLRQWAEHTRPIDKILRQRIREEVDAHRGIFNPDFELEVSNFWKFNTLHDNGAFGGVHPAIFANLIYYFTDPGDSVLDPMAGTGLLAYVLGAYRFYREEYEAEFSGQRFALMSDLEPTADDIWQADARETLPFEDDVAKLAILDPPYFKIADSKNYANLGNTLQEWLDALKQVLGNVRRCLQSDGMVAIMTDDVLRKGNHQPIAFLVTNILRTAGFVPIATFYNPNPNFVYSMGPAMMKAAKSARFVCSGCKVIQVAKKR
jgi:hypothetical protein